MNLKRYTIAGSVSLVVHAAILFVAHESKSYAMPSGHQTPAVSIKFAQPSTSKNAAVEPEPQQPVEEVAEPTPPPEPIEPPPIKEEVKKPPVKTPKKVVKKAPPKPVEKKPEVKKVEKKKPKPVQKPQPKPKPKKAEPKPVVEKKVVEKKLAAKQDVEELKKEPASRAGVNQDPVLVERPSFLTKPRPPKYPRIARKRGIEGIALYEVWLDEEGKQVKQVLISSSGATMLDKSALDAIKKWKFSPHSVGGKSVAHRVKIPVRFKLD